MNRYARRYREIQKRGIKGGQKIIRIVFLCFFLLIFLTFYSVWSRSFARRQAGEMEQLRRRTCELSADIDRIRKELDSLTSRASILERATRELDMVFPGQEDLVFVVMSENNIVEVDSETAGGRE